jgi:hypothetical protein
MKALISETPKTPFIADIPLPPIKVTVQTKVLN